MNKYVVINGNPVDGWTFHGSFDTYTEAYEWGMGNYDESGFTVATLHDIKED